MQNRPDERQRSSGMVLTLLILAFTSIAATTWHDRQEVSTVEVIGATDLSREAVTLVLDSCVHVQRRALVLSDVRARIESIPFVRSASVYFSDVRGLTAEVNERTPVAHIVMDDGTLRYVDAYGIVLPPTREHVDNCLPVVSGVNAPEHHADRVRALVQVLNQAKDELDPALFDEVSEVVLASDGSVKVLTDRLTWWLGDVTSERSRTAFADMNSFWKAVASGTTLGSVRDIDLRWQHAVVLRPMQKEQREVTEGQRSI